MTSVKRSLLTSTVPEKQLQRKSLYYTLDHHQLRIHSGRRDIQIEHVSAGTPLTNCHYIASPRGEMYGAEHSISRLQVEVTTTIRPQTPVPNLYLTGKCILDFARGFLRTKRCFTSNSIFTLRITMSVIDDIIFYCDRSDLRTYCKSLLV
uniref:Uncharacterized protein n=1 Tax=Anolis carolinensis TaxID=28377 RepID=A0A803STI5_ANOCA